MVGDMTASEQDEMCAHMGSKRASAEFFAPVESDVPTLIFAGDFDPATPKFDGHVAARFLSHATVVEVAGASHAPFYTDDCTKHIAVTFFDAPAQAPDLSCLAKRPPVHFATPQEFDAFLVSLKSS